MIEIPVSDVAEAVAFYERAFGARPLSGGTPDVVDMALHDDLDLIFRVSNEARRPAEPGYTKGAEPRLELRVDDVSEWVSRAEAAGATALFRLTPGADGVLRDAASGEGPIEYANIVDPFGHRWALTTP